MKKKITHGIVLLLSLSLAGCAAAEAASTSKPWPTHAPEATPYVRVYDQENDAPVDEAASLLHDTRTPSWRNGIL